MEDPPAPIRAPGQRPPQQQRPGTEIEMTATANPLRDGAASNAEAQWGGGFQRGAAPGTNQGQGKNLVTVDL